MHKRNLQCQLRQIKKIVQLLSDSASSGISNPDQTINIFRATIIGNSAVYVLAIFFYTDPIFI